MTIQYNVTLHDGATNNNGIITNLGYAEINNVIDFASATSWEIQVKVIGGYGDSAYAIGGTDSDCGIFIKFSDNYYRPILIDSNGNYIGGADGTQYVTWGSASSNYTLTLKFTGTQYEFYKDGSLSATIESSTPVKSFNSPLCLGNDYNSGSFDYPAQQIDLNDCYIKVDGANVWSGVSQGYDGVHIQLRRDTLANWTSVNPTLYNGEVGLITDQAKYVVGDGSSTFSSLTKHNMDTDISNLANKDLSNLTVTGEKHFLNKTQITNCILEAPNGTHTVSGSTLTLKAGLKVLMPIGRNTNGTMNNVEYAIPSDISFTYPFNIYIPKDFIWVELNGTIDRLQAEFVYYINWYSELVYTGNNQYRLAYVAQDNLWYFTSDAGNTWTSRTICPVGYATIETNNTISALSIYGTARIFTQNDSAAISRFSLPSSYSIGLAIGASGTTYTAPANGYFYVGWHALSTGQWVCLFNSSIGMDSVVIRSAGGATNSAWWYRTHLPVRQGDVVVFSYDAVIDFMSFKFMSYTDREIR